MSNCNLSCSDDDSIIIVEELPREIIEIESCYSGGGGGGGGVGEVIYGVIQPDENKVIDSNEASTFMGCQYISNIHSSEESKNSFFIVSCLKLALDTEDQLYNKSGDSLQIEVETLINGSNIELKIKNKEAFILSYRIIKLKI